MRNAVVLRNVSKSFKKEKVLKNITHSFEQGKIHGIMGFNGSGKTVMFKCICGFLRPDAGAVYVQGRRIGREIDFPESVGMIIERNQRSNGKSRAGSVFKKESETVFTGNERTAGHRTGDHGKSGSPRSG